jgi:hypothetical protein
MASLSVRPVYPPPPPQYVLELNQDELDALMSICANVGGHPDTTWRGHIADVGKVIRPFATLDRFISLGSIYALNK